MMVETQPNPMVEKREYRMHHDVPVLLAQPCSELPGNLHSHRRSRTDGKRKVKAAGMPHSKSPSIFDHRVRNPSTIESNYQQETLGDAHMRMFTDNPITSVKEDAFGFATFAQVMREAILQTEPLPFSVGIFGAWGSGKSSFMRLLELLIANKPEVRSIWFDPWKYD